MEHEECVWLRVAPSFCLHTPVHSNLDMHTINRCEYMHAEENRPQICTRVVHYNATTNKPKTLITLGQKLGRI